MARNGVISKPNWTSLNTDWIIFIDAPFNKEELSMSFAFILYSVDQEEFMHIGDGSDKETTTTYAEAKAMLKATSWLKNNILSSVSFVTDWKSIAEYLNLSGLRINLTKSTTISIGDTTHDEFVEDVLGCTLEDFPFKYLGMPARAQYRCKKIWDVVVESVEKRLEGWERRYLSYGGILVLIKNVLCALAVYLMYAFTIPPPVAKKIEREMRTLFWGTKDGRNRTALVAWHKVCHSKQEGGLRIKVISVMNDALLCKWLWKFSNEPEALWRRFVEDKYGCDNNGWDAKQTKRPYGMGLWRGFETEWINSDWE
ncbi:uncharacterized protein LOC113316789 [Papaver somniferum]|uniref:uncharacterized protein LOC113316789 n=1 Tax=Papaver somniferum TaxID=3469 RepID=UPI000E6FF8D7|nr:uncharacterized protein LOC113316789 [Papaver somniferum]